MNIGFLYNIDRFHRPLEIDGDSPKTIKYMIKYLQKYHHVFPIEANDKAYMKLFKLRSKLDLVFNYSIGVYGEDRYAHFPSILELLRIPYTGSGPLTQVLVLSKSTMYKILAYHNISTPKTYCFNSPNAVKKVATDFPLLVKPDAQGTSAGITSESVVFNYEDLKKQVAMVNTIFHQPALVQPFINGRELTISLLGNPPKVLPIIEINYDVIPKSRLHFMPDSWNTESYGENFTICPAVLTLELKKELEKIALDCFKALNIKDYCRIDVRLDQKNNIYVLDVNSPTALAPPEAEKNDLFPLSAKKNGLDYSDLLEKIIETAMARYK